MGSCTRRPGPQLIQAAAEAVEPLRQRPVRDVEQGPDGFVYFATAPPNDTPDGTIIRLEPALRTTS
jgi:glucose/arabinose dehydrogenase